MAAVWDSVADYVHSLGLDAYVVGGAVRDELLGRTPPELDFVVPGVGHDELRAALEPHGKVEDLVVADQRVGVRLLPRDKEARALQPAGIEFTPPRVERSTGPGRHDFEIVADSEISLEQDMERRDFTINAIARRLETGEIVDPLGGRADLERHILRTTGPASFRDDPLRIVRGLRFVSQLDVDPDDDTLRQMREWAPRIEHVSGERIGGGLAADGLGELSKLLLGPHPAKALRLARDTGVLVHVLPEFAPAIGYEQQSDRQTLTLDEHVFAVVQAAADAGTPLEVRLAGLLHDLGKPEAERGGGDHAAIGAVAASQALNRLRYPSRLRAYVVRLVREHPFALADEPQPVDARRFLAAPRRAPRLRPARAPCRRSRRQDRAADRVGAARPLPGTGRAGADAAAPACRPGRGRARSDRAGVHRRAAARADLADAPRGGRRGARAERASATPHPRDGAGVIRWDVPGPYEVVFSTREGGVSGGPYASLNLGRMTGDDVERVDENRRLLCAAIGADPERLALNRQVHSTLVRRAEPGARGEPGDGLWTDEPDVPILAMSADCLPIALARTEGEPAVAVLHAGWRGLLAGIVRVGAETLGGRLQAAVGPAIGPCCYEVGTEVSEPFASAFGADVVPGGKLDLWSAAERALNAAGVDDVLRTDVCTCCNPDRFFSHRRTGKPRGVQGVIARVA